MDEIHADSVEIISKPKQFVEPGRTSTKEEVVGFISSVNIRKGEQVTLNKIVSPGVKTGLSRQVGPGKRAISVPVSDENAVNRLIKPGDRIDLIATLDPPGSQRGSQVTKTLLQDVLVLAVGEWAATQAPRKIEKDDASGKDVVINLSIARNFNTITLEVDPAMAQQLAHLRIAFTMTITLRNNDDSERVMVGGTTLVDILGADVNRVMRLPASQR